MKTCACEKPGPPTADDLTHVLEHLQAHGLIERTVVSNAWGQLSIVYKLADVADDVERHR